MALCARKCSLKRARGVARLVLRRAKTAIYTSSRPACSAVFKYFFKKCVERTYNMKLVEQVKLRQAIQAQYPDAEVSLHYNVLWEDGKLVPEYYASIKKGTLSITVPIASDASLDSIIAKLERGIPQLNMDEVPQWEEHNGRI